MSDDFEFKDYHIHLPPLGEGTYGRVFRATYRGISDRALKIFRPGAVDLSAMARELEKLSSVAEHHGIVTLHDFDLLHEPPYYSMGLHADQSGAEGAWETRTLERLCGHVDGREGWRLVKEIADALAYLHRHQIVHCDIKPSNILLTDEAPFRIKICDFGQSRGMAAEGFEPVGTPLYASPEQLRHPVDSGDGKGFRWDVYSFGVVAYKLITGELPRLQELAEAERKSFDPESTLVESSLEATLAEAEGREAIDGERLATMVEAVDEIEWPSHVSLSPERRDLIESCLSLDPGERPADMREVWNTIRNIDSQVLVRRARRLNALFGTLLVVSIWASGFAFVQARKAKAASEAATTSREQAEELAFFIVKKLNYEELSGPGLDELYEHIASHSETYLSNMPKDVNSAKLLAVTANTATLRGRQAFEKGDLDIALEHFENAYGIRSQLAESEAAGAEMAWLASRDLMNIGNLHESKEQWDEALESFEMAFEWRSRNLDLEKALGLVELRQLIECVRSIGRIHQRLENLDDAIEVYRQAVSWFDLSLASSGAGPAAGLGRDLVPLLRDLGSVELAAGQLDESSRTFERLLLLAQSLRNGPPSIRSEAESAYINALGSLGRIELAKEQPASALNLFREEIQLLERESRTRPGDVRVRIALAESYFHAAQCHDAEIEVERLRAIDLLQEAVALVSRVPADLRESYGVEARLIEYNRRISVLLEAEE